MNARRIAYEVLLDVTERGAYTNLRLKQGLASLSQADADWISAAVYTTLDHLLYIDYVLEAFTTGRVRPAIRCVLRLGVCQALFMRVPARTACDESVKLAAEIGKAAQRGYVNGVMRSVCRAAETGALPPLPTQTDKRLGIQYSYPPYLVNEYLRRFGPVFTEAMLAYQLHGVTLRTQPPYTDEAFAAWLQARDLAYHRGEIVPEAFCLDEGFPVAREPLFAEGKLAVQSQSAMLVCRALGVRDGMRVLDACCAPGGKTAYLSKLMHDTGHILGWELHAHRAELAKKTLARLHVRNAEITVRDAAVPDASFCGQFDAVLIDAPCSGLGVPGKPDARYTKDDGCIRELADIQRAILEACCAYVKPGGVLLYATCTISLPENEAQVQAFLERHDEFSLSSLAPFLPDAMRIEGEAGMMQLFPHLHGTEGFFLARMEKKA